MGDNKILKFFSEKNQETSLKAKIIWIIVILVLLFSWGLYLHHWFNYNLITPLTKASGKFYKENKENLDKDDKHFEVVPLDTISNDFWGTYCGLGYWWHFAKSPLIASAICFIMLGAGAYFLSQIFKLKSWKDAGFKRGQREGRQEYEEKAFEYGEEVRELRMSADVQKGLQQERELREIKKKLEGILQEDNGLKKANRNLREENKGLKKTNRKLKKEEQPEKEIVPILKKKPTKEPEKETEWEPILKKKPKYGD